MTDDYRDETGEEIVRALKSAGADAVREALVGGRFYRDDPDDTSEIVAAPAGEPVLIVRGGGRERRLPYAMIGQGYVIPNGPELRVALAATRTPQDKRLDHAANVLARHRINASMLSIDDRLALAQAFEITDAGRLPEHALRLRAYQMLRDRAWHRQAIPLLEQWSALLPPDSAKAITVLIALGACYRHSGQIGRALGITERLAARPGIMQSRTKAVFACEHAAILMDMFERDGDQQRLTEARRWAGIAWRLDPSDYANQLYQRLKSLETASRR